MEPRARRGVAVIVVGCLIMAAVCVTYLRGQLPLPGPAASPTAGPSPPRVALPIRLVSFADAERGGVIFGPSAANTRGLLYLTADGGRTWRHVLPAADVGGVEILDRQHLATLPSFGSTIWTSADFGRTWRAAHLPVTTADERPAGLTFVDARHAWLMVEPRDPRSPPHALELWWTGDGGRHWRLTQATGLPQDAAVALAFLDPQQGVAVVNRDAGGHAEAPLLYLTDDGGATWHQGALPPMPPSSASDALGWARLLTAGGRLLLLYGQAAGVILLTASDDRGQTWSPATRLPAATSSGIVAGAGQLASLAVGELWTSDDDGKHWLSRTVGLPPRLFEVHLVAVVPGALFVEAARASPALIDTVFRSTDGGAHWARVPLPVVA